MNFFARLFFLLLIVLGCNIVVYAQPGFGKATLLNEDWNFTLDLKGTVATQPTANAQWQQVTLPHDWSIKKQLSPKNASCMGYLPGGIGWYKKNGCCTTNE